MLTTCVSLDMLGAWLKHFGHKIACFSPFFNVNISVRV